MDKRLIRSPKQNETQFHLITELPLKKKKNKKTKNKTQKNKMINIIRTYFRSAGAILLASAGHNHNIGLSWAGPEDDAIPVQIIPGGPGLYHLNRASGQSKSHGPHGPCSGPIHE